MWWEIHKLKQKELESQTEQLSRLVFERATYQAIASMVIPGIVVNGGHLISSKIFHRIGRYQKWGKLACLYQ